MRILRSYILKQHLVPFLLGFGVITFILEMDVLVDYLDLVVNRGVALGVVAQLFALSLGYIVALSVPCAVLVAVLMTFGRLSQDNEITALRASGINLGNVLLGPLAAAVVLAVGLTLFNNHVLPATNHAFANLLVDIGRMRPTVKLQEGVFITDFPGYNLLVQSVNGRTNEMHGVTIYQTNPGGGPPTTILAKHGMSLLHARRPRRGAANSRTARSTRSRRTPRARATTGGSSSRRTSSTSPAPAECWSARCATARSDREMSARELTHRARRAAGSTDALVAPGARGAPDRRAESHDRSRAMLAPEHRALAASARRPD